MNIGSRTLTVVAIIGIACALIAAMTLWLLLTDPVTTASAVSEGSVTLVVRSLARALVEGMEVLLKYL